MTAAWIVIGLVALAALAAAPLFLPWPQQLRWMVASMSVPDPVTGALGPAPFTVREVVVDDHRPAAGHVTVRVREIAVAGQTEWWITEGDGAPVAGCVLDGTPLLLMVAEDGRAVLYGPRHAAVGLRRPGDHLPTRLMFGTVPSPLHCE